LSDPTARYHGGASTSAAAGKAAAAMRKGRMDAVVMALSTRRALMEGLTGEELEEATGIPHQSMGGIILKLIEAKRIHRPGHKRKTKSGADAWVCFYGDGPNVGRAQRSNKEAEYADLIQRIANAIARGELTGPAADAARIAIERAGFRGKR